MTRTGNGMDQQQVLIQALAQAITAPDDDSAAAAVSLAHTIADEITRSRAGCLNSAV